MARDKNTRVRTNNPNNPDLQEGEQVIIEYTETGENGGVSLYPLNDGKYENIDGKKLITERK